MNHVRRLLLDGLHNTRDLGGYATADGGVTKFGVFVRSEAPCNLPKHTVQALLDYGLVASADLRGQSEQISRPSSLNGPMSYHPFCLAGDAESFSLSSEICWEQVYIARAQGNKPWAKAFFEFAASLEGGLLFHCTTGKDRAGILSAYLLAAVGVSDQDIAVDYCASQVYLEPVFQGMRDGSLAIGRGDGQFHETVFITPPSAMLGFLNYLNTTYGSVLAYLKDAGITQETLDKLRKKFVTSN